MKNSITDEATASKFTDEDKTTITDLYTSGLQVAESSQSYEEMEEKQKELEGKYQEFMMKMY